MVRKKSVSVRLNTGVSKRKQTEILRPKSISLNTTCSEELFIGQVLVGTTMNFPPEKWLKCRLTFISVPEEVDNIHIEFDEISLIVTLIMDTDLLKEIITANIFSFQFYLETQDFFMKIYLRGLPLPKFTTRIGNCLKTIFKLIDNINLSDLEDQDNCEKFEVTDINKLYKLLSTARPDLSDFDFKDIQHPCLKPRLRNYQKDSIKWMLKKETKPESIHDELHPLYTPLKLRSGLEVYFDKFSGYLTPLKPTVTSIDKAGILAEEMGLGKTVEFLALILHHPFVGEENKEEENSITTPENSIITPENLHDDSSDSDSNSDLPIIKRQLKKTTHRKKQKKECKEDEEVEYQARDIKVPSDWVKKTKRKSTNWVALQLWYHSALSEVNHKPLRVTDLVECICGETHETGKIKCVNCGKFQHRDCLGYQKKLGPFYCPSCWLDQPLVESSATLIVTPISLRTQWCNEIKKHINKSLSVLIYEGSCKTPVYPSYLKNFDIVITTYNVLQAEFRLSEKGQTCELRRKRKYDYPGSPLSRVKWWRLCLDEAQTVETPGRIVSAMARKLEAEYRWAVTGTPMSKSVSDLYGLIDYLQLEPYNELETWKNILFDPYQRGDAKPLCSFLAKVMWRSSKIDVIDQIDIPQQSIINHSLEFSAVEKFFYNKEHELSSEAFLMRLKNMDTTLPLAKLDKSTLKKIMQPLLSLRQVCTHPNTVRGRYLATKKQVSTMKDLLEALILKNSTENEEHLRLAISSHNGLAGIYLLMQNPVQAANEYRKVLQLSARFSEENSETALSVDKLQLIHTMHNLAELIDCNENIPPTLHDSTLRTDCQRLEQKYIEKFINSTFLSYQESNNSQSITNELYEQFLLKNGQWYSDGLDWVTITNLTDELFNKIRSNHDIAHVKCPIDLTCERTILYFISEWDEQVIDQRADLINIINRLFTYKENEKYKILVDQKLVQKATDCHLRPEEKTTGKKNKCPMCVANDFLKKYEFKLYDMKKRTVAYEEMSLQGSWKQTSQELILKALLQILRNKNATESLIKDGETHISILDNLKKEFKEIRKLWTLLCQQIAAQDELDMCKIKLRLEDPSTQNNKKNPKAADLKRLSYILENKLDTIYTLNEHELEYHMMLLRGEETKGLNNLERTLGIRSYLQTLRKQQYEGQSPDPCPICRNVLDQHWSILRCGHSYCMECIHKLLEKTSGANLTCCVCRQSQAVQDISYIRSATVKHENPNIDIKGNFSTKMEAVIKCLLELKEEDENVKVLVFSSWLAVLKLLKEALTLNSIEAEILLNSKLEERIENFKDESQKITALLLPINLGGKGLNLIEATHVILIEPLLNPGDELQAIGRVHRIGQTRPTYVHKFSIKNTIEESILTATISDADKWDKNKVTINQLKDLFKKVETAKESNSCDSNS